MTRVFNAEEFITALNSQEQKIEIAASFTVDSTINVTYPLTIQGTEHNLFTITSGSNAESLFKVSEGGSVTISNLTLKDDITEQVHCCGTGESEKGTELFQQQNLCRDFGVVCVQTKDIYAVSEQNTDTSNDILDGKQTASKEELVTKLSESNFSVIFLSNVTETIDIQDVPEPITLMRGQSVAIPAIIPKRRGYIFIGWNMQADGSDTSFYSGQVLPELQQDIVLYAQWQAVNTLQRTIIFSANCSSPAVAGIPMPITIQFGQRAVLPNTAPVLHGSRFMGWNTRPDGKGIMYIPGQKMAMVTEDTILYAQWLSVFPDV